MQNELNTAIMAARKAGALLRSRFCLPHQITEKAPTNIVTEMDLMAEKMISEMILDKFPDHQILGEEQTNDHGGDNKKPKWIVDPLDGTTNYAHGYPLFAVSIALEINNSVVLGVVYNPLLDELFTAQKGEGAFLNQQAIRVSGTESLSGSLVASGFPYDAWTNDNDNGREWHHFLKHTISSRSDGVAALDLCHVAAGRVDGYWELELEPWDMAAGALIAQEAGACVTSVDGTPYSPYKRNVLASNGRLHQAMLSVLAEE